MGSEPPDPGSALSALSNKGLRSTYTFHRWRTRKQLSARRSFCSWHNWLPATSQERPVFTRTSIRNESSAGIPQVCSTETGRGGKRQRLDSSDKHGHVTIKQQTDMIIAPDANAAEVTFVHLAFYLRCRLHNFPSHVINYKVFHGWRGSERGINQCRVRWSWTVPSISGCSSVVMTKGQENKGREEPVK